MNPHPPGTLAAEAWEAREAARDLGRQLAQVLRLEAIARWLARRL